MMKIEKHNKWWYIMENKGGEWLAVARYTTKRQAEHGLECLMARRKFYADLQERGL